MARRTASIVVLVFLTGAAGCNGTSPTLAGTVTFQGQPLPSGTVLFHGADGRVEHSLITDSQYTIVNAPLGPVRITVQSHAAAPAGLPTHGGKPPPTPTDLAGPLPAERDRRLVAIPARYRDPEKSGLTYVVQAGSQTHNIELLP